MSRILPMVRSDSDSNASAVEVGQGGVQRSTRPKFVLVAVALVLALVASACGGEATQSASSGEFPTTEVVSLADGESVSFDSTVAGGDTPILLWFFFPH